MKFNLFGNQEYKKNRFMLGLYIILILIVISSIIFQIKYQRYENVFTCVLTLILFLIPRFIDYRFKIDLPRTLEVIIVLFIFAADFLGEVNGFYQRFPWWDSMLHMSNGFLMAGVGFSLIDILNQSHRVQFHLSPAFVVMVAFCFSMTIGVLWEFFEFFADQILRTDMQKDAIVNSISSITMNDISINKSILVSGIDDVILKGNHLLIDGALAKNGMIAMSDYGINGYLDIGIIDTMKDMMINFLGAVIFSIIGYLYLIGRAKGKFIECIVPKFTELSKNNSNGKSLTNIKKTGGSILKINKDRKNDDE